MVLLWKRWRKKTDVELAHPGLPGKVSYNRGGMLVVKAFV